MLETLQGLFFEKKRRKRAVEALQNLISHRIPKKLVYQLNNEIGYLLEEIREVVRYADDYIDQLIKH